MSKLLDYLAPWWRRAHLADQAARAVGEPFDVWRGLLNGLPGYFDAHGAPDSWLDWLMWLLGFYPAGDMAPSRKRNLIARAGDIWRKKGTATGLEFYLQAIAGVDASVMDFNEHAFIAGVSRAGDICGPGDSAWFFFVLAPTSVQSDLSVEAVIDPLTPAFCDYLVNYL